MAFDKDNKNLLPNCLIGTLTHWHIDPLAHCPIHPIFKCFHHIYFFIGVRGLIFGLETKRYAMKRLLTSLLLVISAGLAVAQQQTTIYGSLKNCRDINISMKDEVLDTTGYSFFLEKTLRAKSTLYDDSTYRIKTDEVQRPSYWIFQYGKKSVVILLSPGDSLKLDLDCEKQVSRSDFLGKGAGRNIYLDNKILEFDPRKDNYRENCPDGPERVEPAKQIRDDQLELLKHNFQQGIVDSSFYKWETRQINYEYLYYLLFTGHGGLPKDPELLDIIGRELGNLNISDEVSIMSSPYYQYLIGLYPGFTRNPRDPYGKKESLDLKDKLKLGKEIYSGFIESYYCWRVVFGPVQEADDLRERDKIISYALKYVDDPFVIKWLNQQKGKSRLSKEGEDLPYQTGLGIAVMILLILIILVLLYWVFDQTQKGKLHKVIMVITVLITIAVIYVFFKYIFKYPFQNLYWFSLGLFLLYFFAAFVALCIIYLKKRRYLSFTIGVLALFVAYYFSSYLIFKYFGSWPSEEMPARHRAWFIITLFASVLAGLISVYSAKKINWSNRSAKIWDILIKNLEFVVHFLLILTLVLIFGKHLGESPANLKSFIIVFMAITIFYLFAFGLIPEYLRKKNLKWLLLYSLITIGTIELLVVIIEAGFLKVKMHSMLPGLGIIELFNWPDGNGLIVFLSIPGIIYGMIRYKISFRSKQNVQLFRKKEAELNQLRSQVNPHFLFNSLNSVYALALKEKNEKTAESIAKLASMMRYLIDDMEQDKIPVRKEIGYIEDYVKLQLIRSSVEHNIKINVDLTEDQQDWEIAPMLMIPFVENAFKHGINPNNPSELEISFSNSKNGFLFRIEN